VVPTIYKPPRLPGERRCLVLMTNSPKEATMADLVAITYPDEHRAAEVLATLKRLQHEYLIDLEDSCVVTKDAQGKIKLHQSVNLTATGALSGAFWGSLVGLLFFFPLGGAAIGAAAGALTGALSDYGIDDQFIRSLSEQMTPGSSAIFMLVRKVTTDKVEPELAKFGGKILYTSVSKEAEAKFQAMLDSVNQP
jgi:uncharacterized membrane protein